MTRKLYKVTVEVVADSADEATYNVKRGLDKQGYSPITIEVESVPEERVKELTADWED